MNFLTIMLLAQQAPAEGGQPQGSSWSFWIMMILIFVVMWLFMIRPQQKKQKELEKQRESMKNGDKVVTAGGIHGKIKQVEDNTFLVEVAPNTCIRIDKASVFAVAEEVKKEEKKDDKKEDKKD